MSDLGRLVLWVGGFLLMWGLVLTADRAQGHEAASGFQYPYECCHDADCAEVESASERDGEAVGHTRHHNAVTLDPKRYMQQRPSPDGKTHICATPDDKIRAGQNRVLYCIFQAAGV